MLSFALLAFSLQAPQTCEIVRVVDGDTLHVLCDGKLEKLRLLSVDTEEKQLGNPSSPSKPETPFGEACAQWAQDYFASFAQPGENPRVQLRFPSEHEERDIYGRLLCHVIAPDGTDFNLLLVERGKSPYFNKYGNSRIAHDEFVAAQAAARAARLGIWNPRTNMLPRVGAPAARRPYDELLPWWQARAEALEAFDARRRIEPDKWIAADDPDALERMASRGAEVNVFGSIDRIFDEDDGSRTLLFRTPDREHALRVRIPRDDRRAHAALELERSLDEFQQNYLYVRGVVRHDRDAFDLISPGPSAIRRAQPSPAEVAQLPLPAARVTWIAHRGNSSVAPENTLAAVRSALALDPPPDFVEIDVHASADGRLVVIHDTTLDRTTDREGAISELSFDEIRSASAGYSESFGDAFEAQRVPTLTEVLDLVADTDIGIMIEIKPHGLGRQVARLVAARGETHKHLIASFKAAVVVAAELEQPAIRTLYLSSTAAPEDVELAHLIDADILGFGHDADLSAEAKARAAERGLRLWAYTVDDKQRVETLLEHGIHGVISNALADVR